MRIHLRYSLRNRPILQRIAALLGAAKPEAQYATCPGCATTRVTKLDPEVPAERVVRTPWVAIQRRLGGDRYHCGFCQAQFYDCRKRIPKIQPIDEIVVRRRTPFPESERA